MLAQAIGYNSVEDVIQNLKDAGCDQETIERFMNCMNQGDLNGQLRLMEEHRKCILDRVHKEEKQIDCLDYLVYQIDRNRTDIKKSGR
ncbi:MAG: hypothetical protein NC313_07705 [Butyrivibrio sp.]|nr:hypothetical protein [Butyrivibrio sp.]